MESDLHAEGTWLEAISVFRCAAAGESAAGLRLLTTSADPQRVMHGLLRMLSVYLRGEEPAKVARFVELAYEAGPPPVCPVDRQ